MVHRVVGKVGYGDPERRGDRVLGRGRDPSAYVTALGGSLWFTATGPGGSNDVYQMTTGGSLTQYVLPSSWIVSDITGGPDGRVWFGSSDNALTAMDSYGSYTTYTWSRSYPNGTQPQYIRPDSTGALVFANRSGAIGRMTITGAVSFTSIRPATPAVGLAWRRTARSGSPSRPPTRSGCCPAAPPFPPTVPVARHTAAPAAPNTPPGPGFQGAGVNTATGALHDRTHPRAAARPRPGVRVRPRVHLAGHRQRAAGAGVDRPYQAASLRRFREGHVHRRDGQQMSSPKCQRHLHRRRGGVRDAGRGLGRVPGEPARRLLNFSTAGQLTSMTDRSGSGVTLAYTGGQVTSVKDTGGRTVTLATTPPAC